MGSGIALFGAFITELLLRLFFLLWIIVPAGVSVLAARWFVIRSLWRLGGVVGLGIILLSLRLGLLSLQGSGEAGLAFLLPRGASALVQLTIFIVAILVIYRDYRASPRREQVSLRERFLNQVATNLSVRRMLAR